MEAALLKAVCKELWSIVKKATETIGPFHDRLISIESALKTLIPIVEQIETSNDQLGISRNELGKLHELLKGGIVLIRKCSDLKANVFGKMFDYTGPTQGYCSDAIEPAAVGLLIEYLCSKYKLSNRLLELDDQIASFCQRELAVINARNTLAVRCDLNKLNDKFDRLRLMVEEGKSGAEKDVGSSSKITDFKRCNNVPQGPDFVVGLDDSFKEMKEKLLNEKVPVPVAIISAPAGYGKTTLVKKLCNDHTVAGRYKDNIIFIVFSESPNVTTIVRKIANHFQEAVPETASEDDALQQLQELLAEKAKKNPILLILDDIWSCSKSLLEKFVFENIKNYKVLVTSRFEFPEIVSSHKLEGLKHEDAVKLLCHAAKPPMIPNEEVINEVVKRCKGSPLALTVVGKSLCGKYESAWKSKLNEWSGGASLIDADDANSEILNCLINSLKDLDSSKESRRIKQFFLDLGSFPEDHKIPVTVLIDMWSELHGVDGNGVDIVADIKELSARSLADLTEKRKDMSKGDGYYNDMYVTQHDLLRDLAVHYNKEGPLEERERLNLNIRKNNIPEWFLKEQKQPLKARLMSICTDEEFSSEWPDLELPEVEVLILNFRAKDNKYALPDFIKKMRKLKTLIITNNGSLPAELSNFDIIASLSNLKKIRLEHVKIPSHSIDGLCFSNLKKVSTFHCDISEEIQTSEVPFHMVFPALEEVDISYCNNLKTLPKGICEAKTLKKVSITNCHKLSELLENIGNLSELQVLRLNNCTSLETLPSSIQGLEKLSFLDISYCNSIQTLPEEIGKLEKLKEFHLSFCPYLSKLPSSVVGLQKLRYLTVDKEQKENLLLLAEFRRYFESTSKLKLIVAVEDTSLNFTG